MTDDMWPRTRGRMLELHHPNVNHFQVLLLIVCYWAGDTAGSVETRLRYWSGWRIDSVPLGASGGCLSKTFSTQQYTGLTLWVIRWTMVPVLATQYLIPVENGVLQHCSPTIGTSLWVIWYQVTQASKWGYLQNVRTVSLSVCKIRLYHKPVRCAKTGWATAPQIGQSVRKFIPDSVFTLKPHFH